MKSFLLLILTFLSTFVYSQHINPWRDSTVFYGGVEFNSNLTIIKGAGANKVLTSDASGHATWQTAGGGSGWSLTGNSGTTGLNFLGTLTNDTLLFRNFNPGSGGLSQCGFINQRSSTTAFGVGAISNQTGGSANSGFGLSALANVTTGTLNTGIGVSAGGAVTTGSYNIGIGGLALSSTTIGNYNIALGYNSLSNNLIGNQDIAVGNNAGSDSTNLIGSFAIGEKSIVNCSHCGVFFDLDTPHYLGMGDKNPKQFFTDPYLSGFALINTKFYLKDSSQANGKFLQSDANGLSSWSRIAQGNFQAIQINDGNGNLFADNTFLAYNGNMFINSSGAGTLTIGGVTSHSSLTVENGDVYIAPSSGLSGIILVDTGGNCWRIKVTVTTGVLTTTAITCP